MNHALMFSGWLEFGAQGKCTVCVEFSAADLIYSYCPLGTPDFNFTNKLNLTAKLSPGFRGYKISGDISIFLL